MNKVLFIDRDGTLILEPEDEQIDSFEKLQFLPGVFTYLAKIACSEKYKLVMVSNQDGLGSDSFPVETFWPVHNFILETLKGEGVVFDDIRIDDSLPEANSPNRKPATGMLVEYMNDQYDLANSWVIGDRKSDIELAKNLGAKSIFIGPQADSSADLSVKGWKEIWESLILEPRTSRIHRQTAETDILLEMNLDGRGHFNLETGVGFFDHMLELFTRHGSFDLNGKITSDLHVDEHHMVEDTAIVLGQMLSAALGDKRGIGRYAFLLPMDESLAQIALDISGRGELVWEAQFNREKIGDMPTELFSHFFKSFCQHGGINLHVEASGENEHHQIEAIFKGVARTLRDAVKRDSDSNRIPSTKGKL